MKTYKFEVSKRIENTFDTVTTTMVITADTFIDAEAKLHDRLYHSNDDGLITTYRLIGIKVNNYEIK